MNDDRYGRLNDMRNACYSARGDITSTAPMPSAFRHIFVWWAGEHLWGSVPSLCGWQELPDDPAFDEKYKAECQAYIARVKATHIDWPAIIRTFIASHPKAIKRNATLVKFLAELEKAK